MTQYLKVPESLATEALHVVGSLSVDEIAPPAGTITTSVGGEIVQFPYRTYYTPSILRRTIDSARHQARALALCLGTRHHDGRLRESSLRELEILEYRWQIPFVVQLLGEYVVEIANVLEAKLHGLDMQPFRDFAAENVSFMATTRRRVTSYWNCYYRSAYKHIEDFPSHKVLLAMETVDRAA